MKAIIAILVTIAFIKHEKFPFQYDKITVTTILAILYFLIQILGHYFSNYRTFGFHRFELTVYYLIVFFIFSISVNDIKTCNNLLEIASLTALLVSFFGILQYVRLPLLIPESTTRVYSTFGHPNFLAGYLVGIIPISLGLSLTVSSPIKRKLLFLSLILQVLCLFLTLSRSGFLSLTSSLSLFIFIGFYHKKIKLSSFRNIKVHYHKIFLFVALLIVISALILNIPKIEISRLTSLFTPSINNSVWLRVLEFKGTLNAIIENFLFGTGPGTFSIYFPDFQTQDFSKVVIERDEFLRHAHNEFLEVWAETGFFGVVTFLGIIISSLYIGFRHLKSNKLDAYFFLLLGILSSIIGITIQMTFSISFRFIVTPLIFWSFLGTINGLEISTVSKTVQTKIRYKRTVYIISIGISLLFLTYSLLNGRSSLEAEKEYSVGLKHVNNGNYHEGLKHLNRSVELHNRKPEYFYKKGALEMDLKKWENAVKSFSRLNALHPNFFHVNYNLSLCYFYLKNFSEAIKFGNRQIKKYPFFSAQYYVLAKCHYMIEDYKQSEIHFKKHLTFQPENISALTYLGLIAKHNNELETAISVFENIRNKNHNHLRSLLYLADLYLEKNELDKAHRTLCSIYQIPDRLAASEEIYSEFQKIVKNFTQRSSEKSQSISCSNL